MAETVNLGWLKNGNGEKFAPKTLGSQIINSDGTSFEEGINTKINEVKTNLQSEIDSKYEKPSTGVPKTDLASDVQTSLGKADTAIQSLSGYATESYVVSKIAATIDSAPEALNTLNELAAALGDDPNFATTVATQIGTKLDKILTTDCYGPTLPTAGTKGRIFFKKVT